MSIRDFMHAVWPDEGHYCLAYPVKLRDGGLYFKHVVLDTIDHALTFADTEKTSKDIYFAVLTLRQREYFNATKINPRTGEAGVMQTRCGPNMLAAKCFFFDIDAGPGKPYADAAAALAALVEFTNVAELPKPTIVASGNGLHAYWLVDHALHVDKWQPIEAQLKRLAIHHGLQIDPSRTTDSTSLLRVPGTLNHKDPLNPKAVQLWKQAPVLALDDFTGRLNAATIRAGVSGPVHAKATAPTAASILGSNTTREYDGPPVTARQVAGVCAQVHEMIRAQGNLDQPAWYQGQLGTLRWVKDGHRICHQISSGSPTYNKAETDAKLAQLAAFGPSSCTTIASVMPGGEALCKQCPFYGKVPNPLVAARKFASIEVAPVILTLPGAEPVELPVVPPPDPYSFSDEGVVAKAKDADGNLGVEVILPYHLRPVRRLTDAAEGTEALEWEVVLPREGSVRFNMLPKAMYDTRGLADVLSSRGVYPDHSQLGKVGAYMSAYIRELQTQQDAETQVSHMGWTKNFDGFILPHRILTATETRPSSMSAALEQRVEAIRVEGTFEEQVRLMRFYDDDKYIPSQIAILAALAAPLFHMTGHHGVVINASGVTGASKSTTIYTASSMWGHPTEYTLNGTNNGATNLARDAKVDSYANLPVTVDEITYMPVKEIQNLVMGITQPQGRLRLKRDGTERRSSGGHKSTILIASANSSIHGLLSADNTAGTAGSMRVLEMAFRPTGVHTKPEADQFLRGIRANYGHIGPEFIRFVLANYEKVKKRVEDVMAELDTQGNIAPSERFISGVFAVVLVAAEIAKACRWLNYDPAKIRHHMLNVELPHHRGIVVNEYSTPLSILTDYIQTIHGETVMIKPSQMGGVRSNIVTQGPRGALLAHMDQATNELVMLRKGFKDYCTKNGANMTQVLAELSKRTPDGQIITDTNVKRTLGVGTEYATSQSWCVVVNMAHPEVASRLPQGDTAAVHHLHVVK